MLLHWMHCAWRINCHHYCLLLLLLLLLGSIEWKVSFVSRFLPRSLTKIKPKNAQTAAAAVKMFSISLKLNDLDTPFLCQISGLNVSLEWTFNNLFDELTRYLLVWPWNSNTKNVLNRRSPKKLCNAPSRRKNHLSRTVNKKLPATKWIIIRFSLKISSHAFNVADFIVSIVLWSCPPPPPNF